MKRTKITAVILSAALILSFSACTKSTKSIADDPSTDEETTYTDINNTTDSIISTDFATLADTSAASTTETTAAPAQTSQKANAAAKATKTNDKSDMFINAGSGGSTTVTTTKAVTVPTAAPAVQQSLYDIYKAAYNKTHALSSLNANYTSDAKGSMSGSFLYDDSYSGNYKMVSNGNDLTAQIQDNENFSGRSSSQSSSLSFYFAGGYEYVSASNTKDRFQSDQTCMENDANVLHAAYCLPETDFKYAKSSVSNGSTTITLNPGSDSANKLIGESWDSSYKSGSNSFSDSTVVIVINPQGFISSIQITSNESEPLKNPNDGKIYTLILNDTMKITYNNPGQSVTVTAPSDLSSYKAINNPRYS